MFLAPVISAGLDDPCKQGQNAHSTGLSFSVSKEQTDTGLLPHWGNLTIAVVDRMPALWKTEHVTVVGVKNPLHVSLGGHLPAIS